MWVCIGKSNGRLGPAKASNRVGCQWGGEFEFELLGPARYLRVAKGGGWEIDEFRDNKRVVHEYKSCLFWSI